jgi:hypothetical protein
MESSEINDIRSPAEFRGISFSKYKKTAVKDAFIENMLNGKIEPACNWAAELICAGHYLELWENILYYMAKHIHVGNPKLVCYLEKRFIVFKNIMSSVEVTSPLDHRNNQTIRNMFAEIVSVLSLSTKKHSFESIKINREEEFDMTQMTERLVAPSVDYIKPFFRPKDPKEVYIALNEFAYNLSAGRRNTVVACYWIEWIIEFDAICKRRKQVCDCEVREFVVVDRKLSRDLIWMIWDALFHYMKERGSPLVEKVMGSLLTLFSLHYTNACCRKRRYLLYFAVSLCTEQVNPATELVSDMRVVELAVKNINSIYKTIKKSEESPGTDYLFSGLDKKVAMAKQMDMVNSIAPPKIGSGGGGPSSIVGRDNPALKVGRDNPALGRSEGASDKVHIYDANKI